MSSQESTPTQNIPETSAIEQQKPIVLPSESTDSPDISVNILEPEPQPLLPDEVTTALDKVAKRDTYDAVRRRVNGTSALLTRTAAFGGLPAFVTSAVYNSYTFGVQTVVLTGGSVALGASVAAGAFYSASRSRLGARLRKREAEQDTVRGYLGEPAVDLIRTRKGLTLRWYGADEAYDASPKEAVSGVADESQHQDEKQKTSQNAQQGDRLKKIVAFANKANVKSVIVSSRVLDLAPQDKRDDVIAKYADKATSTEKIFKKAKGARLHDRLGDSELLEITPNEASQLVEDLGLSDNAKTETLAQLLLRLNPHHPLKPYFENWQKLGKKPELLGSLRKELRSSLERTISRDVDFRTQGSRYEGTRIEVDPNTGEATEVDFSMRIHARTDGYTSVTGTNANTFDSALLPDGSPYASSQTTALTAYMGYGSPDSIIGKYTQANTHYALHIDEKTENEARAKGEKLVEADLTELELALYEQLHRMHDDAMPHIMHGNGIESHENGLQTFYGRIAQERPRGFLRPWIAKRGTVPAAEQTIEYKRLQWRNAGKKIGALAIITSIGGGTGHTLRELWDESYSWDGGESCREFHGLPPYDPYSREKPIQLTEEQAGVCVENTPSYLQAARVVGDGIEAANSEYENWLILQLYKSNLLDEETVGAFADSVNSSWLAEKYTDLAGRYNLYSGRRTLTSDALLNADPEAAKTSPAVWHLTPSPGVEVDGLWYSGVLDQVTIMNTYGLSDTPPLSSAGVAFSASSLDLFAPGERTSEQSDRPYEEQIRLVNPASELFPADGTRPLVGVGGRHVLETMELVQYGTAEGRTHYYLPLPVQKDTDIVAATFELKELLTDKPVGTVPATVIQRKDGTFAAVMPYNALSSFKREEVYIETNYQFDPNEKPELSIRAIRPLSVESQFHDWAGMKLTDVLKEKDVAELAKSLQLPKSPTLAQVAEAIRDSHTYSYTPYRDAGTSEGSVNPENLALGEVLVTVSEYANKHTSIHCSASAMIAAVTSRGQEVDGSETNFVNGVVGFRNNNDNKLVAHESHVFLTTDDGKVIDATPEGTAQTPDLTPADYKESSASGGIDPETILKGAGLLFAVGALGAAGVQLAPKVPVMVAGVRRRRENRAFSILPDENDEAARQQFREDVGMLVKLQYEEAAYLRSGADYAGRTDHTDLQTTLSQTDPLLLIKNLASLGRTERLRLHELIDTQTYGGIIPADQAERLRQLLNRHTTVKARTEQPSVFAE